MAKRRILSEACVIGNCANEVTCRDMCDSHYARVYTTLVRRNGHSEESAIEMVKEQDNTQIVCLLCGIPLQYPRTKFCCKTHKRQHYDRANKVNHFPSSTVCKICQTEFNVTKKNIVFCSDDCRRKDKAIAQSLYSESESGKVMMMLQRQKPHHKRKVMECSIRRDYGMSMEDYESMLHAQDGVCKICHNPSNVKNRRLNIDHCHKTGKVRGLLCHSCNLMIGHAKDNHEVLSAAALYIKENI